MHSDNLQNWILWRDKLFCDFWLFFYYLDCTKCKFLDFSLTFPNIHFFPDLQQNSLTFPWLLPSLEFPWLFPDRWTPWKTLTPRSPGIPLTNVLQCGKHSHAMASYLMYDMMTSSNFLRYWPFVRGIHRSPQKPVTRNVDDFFDLHLKQRLNKQSSRRWFETPSRPIWRHCNVLLYLCTNTERKRILSIGHFVCAPRQWETTL